MELKQILQVSTSSPDLLLIVPYGIETWNAASTFVVLNSFNRTLWN